MQEVLNNDDVETSFLTSLMHMECRGNMPLALPKKTTSQQSSVPASTSDKSVNRYSTKEAPSNQIVVDQLHSQETPASVALAATAQSDLYGIVTNVELITSKTPIKLPTVKGITTCQTEDISTQLLDLQSCSAKVLCNNREKQAAKIVLNKPSCPAINGEEFTRELARMSHNEILDLRKRNSMGLPCDKERQTMISMEEQSTIEQSIQSELLRREAVDNTERLANIRPLSSVNDKSNENMSTIQSMPPPAPPPNVKQNISKRKQHVQEQSSRSRKRRREAPMTEELKSYLKLSETIAMRLRERSTNMSKRSLYTKGDSDVEDNLSQSPLNKKSRCYNEIEIAPSPPKNSVSNDNVVIVSPPSASLRFSQATCNSRRSKRNMSIEKPTVAQKDVEQANQVNVEQERDVEQAAQETMEQEHAEKARVEVQAPALTDITEMRLRNNGIEIAPAPPKNSVSNDDIDIVSPPPASMRYSQAMCNSRRSKRIMSFEQEKVQEDWNQAMDAQEVGEQARQEEVSQAILEDGQQKRHREMVQAMQVNTEQASQAEVNQAIQVDEELERQEEVEPQETESQPEETDRPPPPPEESSMQMEALRMETPTPPLPATDEQPSTSRAAREALELSLSRQQKKGNKPRKSGRKMQKPKIVKDNAFKQPLPCTPCAPKNKANNIELSRLRINLRNETLPPCENDLTNDQDTTVRRSRRGQVPLSNTWCHTMDDPFGYMRAIYTGDKTINSSTRKRKRVQHEEMSSDGDTITGARTQPSQVEPQRAEIRPRSKNRARLRDKAAVEPPPLTESDPNDPLTQPNESLEENEVAAMQLPEVEQVRPVDQPQMQNYQLLSWLRGVSNSKPDTNVQVNGKHESIVTSSVTELEFSKLSDIEYAFYCTEELGALGYMRLQPLQERRMTQNKANVLRFVVLHGQLKVESSLQHSKPLEEAEINAGDMVEIKKGSRFNITNLLNEVSVLLVIRSCRNVIEK
ncbi:uncharacterized protein LOC117791804 isoform X2 [Drosophila innubila]|uniref:uncharacterized protein LOC117791804 isoform X2 n=1 Tax=Drosophila innubila TaxID=198719 RepID=UPI00148D4B28|nr:uncharacterized protein LOC117791804 isoform X2 [Drosophila innubila]